MHPTHFTSCRVCAASLALLVALVAIGHGQAPASSLAILKNVGLPAVDLGILRGVSRQPARPGVRSNAPRDSANGRIRVGPSGSRSVAGRVVVKFRESVSTADRAASIRRTWPTGAMQPRPDYADFDVIVVDSGADAEAVAAAFRQRPDIEYAQASHLMQRMQTFVPNDPYYKLLQWNLPLIDMERAWAIQPQAGSSITVAVLDTGVAYATATVTATIPSFQQDGVTYPALGRVTIPYSAASQLVTPGRFVAPHDFILNTNTPLDFDGHGTHVSGTIGQLTNDRIGTAGVAFNVKLMPVKVICGGDSDVNWDVLFGVPPELCGTDDQVAQGIRYTADNGAKVINMSLGSYGPPDCGTNPNQGGCSPTIEAALRYAVGKGVFVAVAAGNGFLDGNPTSIVAEIASRIQGVVSVAAVGVDKSHAIYSSTGPWVEVAAPGGGAEDDDSGFVWQQTFDPDYVTTFALPVPQYGPPRFDMLGVVGYAGTSQATPHVAGLAAMLMQQGLTDPAALEAALERFATPCSTSLNRCDSGIAANRNDMFGHGLIEARNTLRGLGIAR